MKTLIAAVVTVPVFFWTIGLASSVVEAFGVRWYAIGPDPLYLPVQIALAVSVATFVLLRRKLA